MSEKNSDNNEKKYLEISIEDVNNIILPAYLAGIKSIISVFAKELTANGVSKETIKASLAPMLPETKKALEIIHKSLIQERVKKPDDKRKNFLGRALLYHIEHFFPKSKDAAEKVIFEQVEGVLPRQVAQGLISAIQSAQGIQLTEKYEKVCDEKAEDYRDGEGGEVDLDAFANDPEVKKISEDMIGKLKSALADLDEDKKKRWLVSIIQNSAKFREMKRRLTDTEYEQLAQGLFQEITSET